MTRNDPNTSPKQKDGKATPRSTASTSAAELETGGELRPDRIGARLRPDRIGARLRPDRIGAKIQSDRLGVRAGEVPAWRLTDDDALLRTWSFPDPLTAACFALFAATLTDAADNPAVIQQHLGRVTVRITSPEVGGLTEADFQLARQLGAAG